MHAVKHPSGHEATGNHILVEIPTVPKYQGLIELPNDDDNQEGKQKSVQYGTVVNIGENCWEDYQTPWCEVGDLIEFTAHGGYWIEGVNGKYYRTINDIDVIGFVTEEVINKKIEELKSSYSARR